ncbi:phospholipase D family protein [Halopseudomonas aestusnigri]|uniref:phospholipase D family protein n=1 Tax=Halopseudomonas aestusnigri TaxID=857252 RepID=UPI0028C19A3F|nr:hypothetical protein YSKK_33980 [Halopseudomonas aestusnigri]
MKKAIRLSGNVYSNDLNTNNGVWLQMATMLTGRDARSIMVELLNKCVRFSAAVAWAGENTVATAMLEHSNKLRHLVIGTHMYQTNPSVLKAFKTLPTARCHHPVGPLFHPKIYLFYFGDRKVCVVGSHNLTAAAFDKGNVEVSLLLDEQGDPAVDELERFVSSQWRSAKRIDDSFLYAYEKQYKQKAHSREDLEKGIAALNPPAQGESVRPIMDLTWRGFVDGVASDKHHTMAGRLAILERAAGLFREYSSLSRMPVRARKAISATYGSAEPQLDGLDWRWFGSMKSSGVFTSLIISSPELISRALDLIPFEGKIQKPDYEAYCEAFSQAFDGQRRVGRLPVASRLLAFKRPDVFAAVNSKNKAGLCASFGVAHTTLGLHNYWERIVLPIQNTEWWNHPRPRAPIEGQIWDSRAALVDSIYYQPGHDL